MKLFWMLDEWLLKKHQKISDIAYSEWEVSPYQIAANIFGFSCLMGFLIFSIAVFVQGKLPTGFSGFSFGVSISICSVWYFLAANRHKRWERDNTPQPETIFDQIFRIFQTSALTVGIVALLFAENDFRDYLIILQMAINTSGFYFYSCLPPTFIDRKKNAFIPQLT